MNFPILYLTTAVFQIFPFSFQASRGEVRHQSTTSLNHVSFHSPHERSHSNFGFQKDPICFHVGIITNTDRAPHHHIWATRQTRHCSPETAIPLSKEEGKQSTHLLENLFGAESSEICARWAWFGRAGDGEKSIVLGLRRVGRTRKEGGEMGLNGVGYLLKILEETEEWILRHLHFGTEDVRNETTGRRNFDNVFPLS